MRARWVGGLLAIGLAAASLTACSDDDQADSTTTSTTTNTTTTPGSVTTVVDTTPETVGDQLPDGEHFGFLVELQETDDGAHHASFDLAYLLTGDAASAAAAADGAELDGDFYIRNDDDTLRDVVLAPDVTILDVDHDHCCEPSNVSLSEFELARLDQAEERTTCYLTIEGGLVTSIEEQYLP